ncbi:MAG: hypothetical protein AAB289_00735 [Chloroflexota bacterium]
MRGVLLKAGSLEYLVNVEYIARESGAYHEGGQYDWEGTFIPELPITLGAAAYVLQMEDGRRGYVNVVQRRQLEEYRTLYRFEGHAGVNP